MALINQARLARAFFRLEKTHDYHSAWRPQPEPRQY